MRDSHKTGFYRKCKMCTKSVYIIPSRITRIKYCSKQCLFNSQKGIKKPPGFGANISRKNKGQKRSFEVRMKLRKAQMERWGKNGRIDDGNGYILLKKWDHPSRNNDGYVREHRFIVEKYIGRFLHKQEDVHHINGVKWDNRPENLYVFPNRSKHIRFHQLFKFSKVKQLKSNIINQI